MNSDATSGYPERRCGIALLLSATLFLASGHGLHAGGTATGEGAAAGADGIRVAAGSAYLLSPFDTVSVSVYEQPDLAIRQRISDAGYVAMPLLGNIEIGGLTVHEAQETIRRALIEEELLRAPMVSLAIEEFAPKQVTVLGQVNRPGTVTLPGGSNSIAIESAIAMAGGFTGTARRNRVRVTRYDPDEERERAFRVDVDEILEESDGDFSATRFHVVPDDIIFVPQRLF